MKLYREVIRSRFLIVDTETAKSLKDYKCAVEPIEITEEEEEVEKEAKEEWQMYCDMVGASTFTKEDAYITGYKSALSKLKGE